MVLLVDVLGEERSGEQLDQAFKVGVGLRVYGSHEIFDLLVALERTVEHGGSLVFQVLGVRGEAWCSLVENATVSLGANDFVERAAELVDGLEDALLTVEVLAALVDGEVGEGALVWVARHKEVVGQRGRPFLIHSHGR